MDDRRSIIHSFILIIQAAALHACCESQGMSCGSRSSDHNNPCYTSFVFGLAAAAAAAGTTAVVVALITTTVTKLTTLSLYRTPPPPRDATVAVVATEDVDVIRRRRKKKYDETLQLRKRYFSNSNSISYENTGPLMILKVRQPSILSTGSRASSYLELES